MGHQDSWWNVPVWSMVIVVSAVLVLSYGQTQTLTHSRHRWTLYSRNSPAWERKVPGKRHFERCRLSSAVDILVCRTSSRTALSQIGEELIKASTSLTTGYSLSPHHNPQNRWFTEHVTCIYVNKNKYNFFCSGITPKGVRQAQVMHTTGIPVRMTML